MFASTISLLGGLAGHRARRPTLQPGPRDYFPGLLRFFWLQVQYNLGQEFWWAMFNRPRGAVCVLFHRGQWLEFDGHSLRFLAEDKSLPWGAKLLYARLGQSHYLYNQAGWQQIPTGLTRVEPLWAELYRVGKLNSAAG